MNPNRRNLQRWTIRSRRQFRDQNPEAEKRKLKRTQQWNDLMRVLSGEGIPVMSREELITGKLNHAEIHASAESLKINVCLPSIGRERIIDAIDSLLTSSRKVEIYPVIQINRTMANRLEYRYSGNPSVHVIFTSEARGWVWAQNHVAKIGGALFASADDVIVTRETIRTFEIALLTLFPNGDGVICPSVTQLHWSLNRETKGSGFMGSFPFVGDKFIDRFPERQIFCPDYFGHGADPELRNYGIFVNRYAQCIDAKVIHFDQRPDEPDETTRIMRALSNDAVEKYWARQERGYIWGKNFDVIGEELKGRT